jgi:hypothetical protein
MSSRQVTHALYVMRYCDRKKVKKCPSRIENSHSHCIHPIHPKSQVESHGFDWSDGLFEADGREAETIDSPLDPGFFRDPSRAKDCRLSDSFSRQGTSYR